jgi:NADP-dependent alcohol dehydrogenase
MKWVWNNSTKVCFGANVVEEQLKNFIPEKSKVLCTFGGGSINQNGSKADVEKALAALNCTVLWEGGIPANPEYKRLMEIVAVVKKEKPDFLLAIGGGSIIDGTKFISVAAKIGEDGEEDYDPWLILKEHRYPKSHYKIGVVLTLPATGSEWNNSFVISRRETEEKLSSGTELTFPVFSLLDPRYTMTLPLRQIRNGIFDGFAHCLDQFMTEQSVPMMDNFWMSVMKELVDISDKLVNDTVSKEEKYELHERLICATTFALNFIFTLGKDECWGIHRIGHLITARYDVDHGQTLSIVAPNFLEETFDVRKHNMAKSAIFVFGVEDKGSDDANARAFIEELRKWIKKIGMPLCLTDAGITPKEGEVEVVTDMVMKSVSNAPFGFRGHITKENVINILRKSFV